MAINKKIFTGEAVAEFDPLQNFETVTYTGNGSTQKITGYIRKGAAFNGSSSKIDYSSPIIPSSGGFSISWWMKWNGDADYTYVFDSAGGGATNGFYCIAHDTSDEVYWNFKNGSYGTNIAVSYPVSERTEWTHFVITWDGTTSANAAKIYKNNVATSGTQTVTQTTSGQNFKIGYLGAEYFNGIIDQVRIFNKALSSSEVTTLYGETYDSSTKSTTDIFGDGSGVALYELDEDASVSETYGTGAIDSGQSGSFNGSSHYVSIADNTALRLTGGDYTISFWFYTNAIGSIQRLVNKDNANDYSAGYGFTLNTGGTITWSHNDGSNNQNWDASYTYSANKWYHVCAVYSDSANLRTLYVNGSSVGTVTTNTDLAGEANVLLFGAYGDTGPLGQYLNGKLDDVRIYSSALSSTDVGYLVTNDTANIPTANLVGYWKLDGNGNDSSGNGYNATTTNISYTTAAEFPEHPYNGTPTAVDFLGMAFQPDFVWVKHRNHPTAHSHNLADSVRGATKLLYSNTTDAEETITNSITSFDSNGFTVGNSAAVNDSYNYVAWSWKAGGAAVSNTDGSITSTVSANQDTGFSIVKYTGNGTSGATIGHGLNSAPELIITKGLTTSYNWNVCTSLSANGYLELNTTVAFNSNSSRYITAGAGTNSLTDYVQFNQNNVSHIQYNFHSVDGYQKIGSYTGNGSTSGPTVTTGFEPRWIMIKRTDDVGNWLIYDAVRDTTNERTFRLYADGSFAEVTTGMGIDFNSDNFQIKDNHIYFNANGGTYIYLAIA